MTQHDTIEPEVRAALAGQASLVPADAAARLGRRDYHPRTRSAASVAAISLVAVAAVATASFYAAGSAGQQHPGPGSRASADQQHPGSGSLASALTIRLDGYTFKLPKGFTKKGTSCALPPPPGLTGTHAPNSAAYAAGATAHGGCVGLILTRQQVTPPASATPVQVAQSQGFLEADPATHSVTLFVRIPTSGSASWLVVTATGLSESQVTNMAGRALA